MFNSRTLRKLEEAQRQEDQARRVVRNSGPDPTKDTKRYTGRPKQTRDRSRAERGRGRPAAATAELGQRRSKRRRRPQRALNAPRHAAPTRQWIKSNG